MTRREALARHPLAIIGALVATASAVVFIALVIAALAGMFHEPVRGSGRLRRDPRRFRHRAAAHPRWDVAAAAEAGSATRPRPRNGRSWTSVAPTFAAPRSSSRRSPPSTSSSSCWRATAACTGWNRRRSAVRSVTRRCSRSSRPGSEAPHARVACVECHIGEGAARIRPREARRRAAARARRDELRIRCRSRLAPKCLRVRRLRPACNCHQPGRVAGDRIRVIREYADDENEHRNDDRASDAHGRRVVFGAGDSLARRTPPSASSTSQPTRRRETIPYVKVTYANGQVKEYVAPDTTDQMIQRRQPPDDGLRRLPQPVGHPFAASAEQGVDQAIAAGSISRDLPFARREGVRLVKASYPSQTKRCRQSIAGCGVSMRHRAVPPTSQRWRGPSRPSGRVSSQRVPHDEGDVGRYPDNKGHITATGCFRCHDDSHTANDGSTISADCEFCHKQIEPATESARNSPTESAARLQHLLTRSARPGPPGGSQRGCHATRRVAIQLSNSTHE